MEWLLISPGRVLSFWHSIAVGVKVKPTILKAILHRQGSLLVVHLSHRIVGAFPPTDNISKRRVVSLHEKAAL